MIEFEIDGKEYRADKLNPFEQFHVSRRISPLIPNLIPVFLEVAKLAKPVVAESTAADSAEIKEENISNAMLGKIDVLAKLMQPFADGLAAMSDNDAEYVMSKCLNVVKMQRQGHWAPIWNDKSKLMMFEDISDMGSMLPLVLRVIQDSLGPFIQGMLTSQIGMTASQA